MTVDLEDCFRGQRKDQMTWSYMCFLAGLLQGRMSRGATLMSCAACILHRRSFVRRVFKGLRKRLIIPIRNAPRHYCVGEISTCRPIGRPRILRLDRIDDYCHHERILARSVVCSPKFRIAVNEIYQIDHIKCDPRIHEPMPNSMPTDRGRIDKTTPPTWARIPK